MSTTDPETPQYGPLGDLEEQQYSILYNAMDVPLQDIRKRSFSRFVIVSLALLILVVVLAATLQIPNYLQVPVVIENVDQDQVMMFNHSVRVTQYLVEVGEAVEPNQPLCKVSSPQIHSLIAEIRIAENNIQALENHDSIDVTLQVEHLASQSTSRQLQLEGLNAEQNAAESLFESRKKALGAEIEYAKKLKEKDQFLLDGAAISEVQYLETERNYLERLDQAALLTNAHNQTLQQFKIRKEELNESVITLKNETEALLSGYRTDRNKLQDQIDFARNNLVLYYGAYQIEPDGLVLLAPGKGTMTYCYPGNQLLETGEILYRLEQSRGQYEAKGMVEANQIGYVKPGMGAKIMLETFPHYEWGSLTGEIEKISSSPNETGAYAVTVLLTESNPRISPLLQNGQTGDCSLIFEEKSLFGYLFRDMKKVTSELAYN